MEESLVSNIPYNSNLKKDKGYYIYIIEEIKDKLEHIMLISRTLIKKKGSSNNIENPFLVSYRFL
jgi:hypothetical protein